MTTMTKMMRTWTSLASSPRCDNNAPVHPSPSPGHASTKRILSWLRNACMRALHHGCWYPQPQVSSAITVPDGHARAPFCVVGLRTWQQSPDEQSHSPACMQEEKEAKAKKDAVIEAAKKRGAEKAKLTKSLIIMEVKPWDDTTGAGSMLPGRQACMATCVCLAQP